MNESRFLKLLFCLTEGERILRVTREYNEYFLITSGDGSDIAGAYEGTLHALQDKFPDITDREILLLTGMFKESDAPNRCTPIDMGYVVDVPESVEETPYTFLHWKAYMGYLADEAREKGLDLCGLSILTWSRMDGEPFEAVGLWEQVFDAVPSLHSFEEFLEDENAFGDPRVVRNYLDDRLFDQYLDLIGAPSRREVSGKIRELARKGQIGSFTNETGTYFRDDWDDQYVKEGELVERLLANKAYWKALQGI